MQSKQQRNEDKSNKGALVTEENTGRKREKLKTKRDGKRERGFDGDIGTNKLKSYRQDHPSGKLG